MANIQSERFSLWDAYRFEGFRPQTGRVRGVVGKKQSVIVPLQRSSKETCCGKCGTAHKGLYDCKAKQLRDLPCGRDQVYLEIEFRRLLCGKCGKVENEGLEWVADNGLYTKRFGKYLEQRCRESSIETVAKELDLAPEIVKEMKKYLRARAEDGDTGFVFDEGVRRY